MTPHKQLIKHDPENGRFGDCYRTCVAAILNMQPEDVPHFFDGCPDNEQAPAAGEASRAWLAERQLVEINIAYDGSVGLDVVLATTGHHCFGAPMILTGQSRLGVNHCVVIMDGKIVCDPSGNGITGPAQPDGYYWATGLGVGPDWVPRRPCPPSVSSPGIARVVPYEGADYGEG